MSTITQRRGFILIICFSACIILLNELRPVYGKSKEENDPEKQVESLTQTVEDQKKQLDSLKAEFERFKAAIVQRDKDTRELIKNQGERLNVHDQKFGSLAENARQQDAVLRQHAADLSQQRDVLREVIKRLKAKGI